MCFHKYITYLTDNEVIKQLRYNTITYSSKYITYLTDNEVIKQLRYNTITYSSKYITYLTDNEVIKQLRYNTITCSSKYSFSWCTLKHGWTHKETCGSHFSHIYRVSFLRSSSIAHT